MNKDKSFVYIWYVEATKKSYIGSSIGKPFYTHSSTDKEFCSYVPYRQEPVNERKAFLSNIPRGITRTIIEYGIYEDMLMLEHKLQTEVDADTNPLYYNKVICDEEYKGFGKHENHYNWKGGISLDKKTYDAERYAERKAELKIYYNDPERKASRKASRQTPWRKAYDKKNNAERRAKNKAETGFTEGYSQAKHLK
jgi:hypothetical protein